jgi:hypothetical protein
VSVRVRARLRRRCAECSLEIRSSENAMKLSRIAITSLALMLIACASCTDSKAGDKTMPKDPPKKVENTSKPVEASKPTDLSKMTPDEMKAKATELTTQISKDLAAVKDSAGAKAFVTKMQPAVDELAKAKSSLMAQQFDMSALKLSVDDAIARFSANKDVMDVLQPMLDKLDALTH